MSPQRARIIDKGYKLPDVLPEDIVCARVYLPKDSLMIAAFWSQYEMLAKWVAWERGGTRAKDAAALYRSLFDRAREINDCAEGDCGIMDVRQKPNEPCTLQKWDDCDSEWIDFADLTLCGTPEPYQDDPADEVNDAIGSFKIIAEQVIDYLDDGKSANEIKIIMSGLIAKVPGISEMIDDMAATSQQDRDDAKAGMDWQEMRDTVFCDRSECHLENFEWYETFSMDWTACLMRNIENWCADTSGKISDWAAQFINDTVPQNFLDLVNTFPGSGGFLDNNLCSWEKIFTWDDNSEGWELYQVNGEYAGSFSSPRGWQETLTNPPGIYIEKTFDDAIITSASFHIYSVATTYMNWYLYLRVNDSWVLANIGGRSEGYEDKGWNAGPVTADGIRFVLADWPIPASSSWIEDVTITGNDFNPFE